MKLTMSIQNSEGYTLLSKTGHDDLFLDYIHPINFGDQVKLEVAQAPCYAVVQVDESLAPAFIYLHETEWIYQYPRKEKEYEAYPSQAFRGGRHILKVRMAKDEERQQYRNLAINTHDQNHEVTSFPHASANVETRNDVTFFARNAIDGYIANQHHGSYPYQSWGINQQADAELRLDFGRPVLIDQLAFVLRGDYPHDSYWTQVTVQFSDGTTKKIELNKTLDRQFVMIEEKKISWLILKDLIKATDESPFPALTELEVYGRDVSE